MAPLLVTPRQGQQDQIQPVLAQQQTDTSALDLGHVVSVQLINKTDRLTLLGHSPSELPSDMSVQCSLVIRQLSGHNVQGSGDVEMESKKPCGSWKSLLDLPNEILLHILSYVDVCDLLSVSRVCRRLRTLSVSPFLHRQRLRRVRDTLPPMLFSATRPSYDELVRRSILLTRTAWASRRLAHNLASARLARRLAMRPSAEELVARAVLPEECVPSWWFRGGQLPKRNGPAVAPSLVEKKRAVERERVKDQLRGWLEKVWMVEVKKKEEMARAWLERKGIGRVWRMRVFWERMARGEA